MHLFIFPNHDLLSSCPSGKLHIISKDEWWTATFSEKSRDITASNSTNKKSYNRTWYSNNLMLFMVSSSLHAECVWLKQKPDVTLQSSHRYFYCEQIPGSEGFVNCEKWWRELGEAEGKRSSKVWVRAQLFGGFHSSPWGLVKQKRQPILAPYDKQEKEPKTPQNSDGLNNP